MFFVAIVTELLFRNSYNMRCRKWIRISLMTFYCQKSLCSLYYDLIPTKICSSLFSISQAQVHWSLIARMFKNRHMKCIHKSRHELMRWPNIYIYEVHGLRKVKIVYIRIETVCNGNHSSVEIQRKSIITVLWFASFQFWHVLRL